MWEEFKAWYLKDRLNILLTISCAVLPLLPGLFSYIQVGVDSNENSGNDGLGSVHFYFSIIQSLISFMGLLVVSLKYKPTAILDVSRKIYLQDYIEDVCRIKQTTKNDSNTAYHVVRTVVRQFYNLWIVIWLIWLLYFGVDTLYCCCISDMQNNYWLKTNMLGLLTLLDFLGSSALYSVYVILNYVTVDIARRTDKHYSDVYWSGIILVLLFVSGSILYFYQMFASGPESVNGGVYLHILLSIFGTFSFVLVLGALNSKYLNVPPVFVMVLYIYAVAQAFSFLYTRNSNGDYGIYASLIDAVNTVLPWITTLGKIVLLIVLSWILDKKRIIFYIVHRSLSITQMKAQLKEFNRYMK